MFSYLQPKQKIKPEHTMEWTQFNNRDCTNYFELHQSVDQFNEGKANLRVGYNCFSDEKEIDINELIEKLCAEYTDDNPVLGSELYQLRELALFMYKYRDHIEHKWARMHLESEVNRLRLLEKDDDR